MRSRTAGASLAVTSDFPDRGVPTMITTGWVRPLTEPGGTVRELGGKGESLTRLAAAGFPVPDGFCLTTAAYEAYLERHDLAAALNDADPEVVAHLFAERPVPDDLADAIRTAYAELGAPPVAVRSSATAEDSAAASFAGQLETVLNVTGDDHLLDAVRRCWASLWTERAIAYRRQHAVGSDGLGVAVVVQRLVPADAAGILFTADPMTGATETVEIDASWGLGDAVVAGDVTPDTFRVDSSTLTVVSRTVADKRVRTVREPTGTALRDVPRHLRRRAPLTDEQAVRLARTGLEIAALYRSPVDVEWCRTADQLFVLQARPITTGTAATEADPWNDSRTTYALWTNTNVGEAVPDVMTPVTWSLVRIFLGDAMATSSIAPYVGYGRIGGRLYLNLSALYGVAGAVGMSEARMRSFTEDVFGRIPDGVPLPPLHARRLRIVAATIPVGIDVARRARRDIRRLPAYLVAHPAHCRRLRARIRRVDQPAELARMWREEILPGLHESSWMLSAATRAGGTSLVTAQRRLRSLVGEADANAMLTGLGGAGGDLASLDLMRGLEDLAAGEISRATFNERYGHRGPHEFEVSTPRPGEDPGWLEAQLAARSEAGATYRALLESQQAIRQEAWNRLRRDHPREADRMERAITRWSGIARNREGARSEVVRYFWVLRAYVIRAGALTGLGDDAFFVDADHLLAALDGGPVDWKAIDAARRAYEAYQRLPSYPPLILGHFHPYAWAADPHRRTDLATEGPEIAASTTVRGFAGSAGKVDGIVRVILDPSDGGDLRDGEVLVTTVTNVGWTPLFPRAAAVITDVGAPLSHAAIVARELGIPAVVGCANATALLHTGDRVRVDGSAGVVERLSETPR
jgi:pyruvate,water dikinase